MPRRSINKPSALRDQVWAVTRMSRPDSLRGLRPHANWANDLWRGLRRSPRSFRPRPKHRLLRKEGTMAAGP